MSFNASSALDQSACASILGLVDGNKILDIEAVGRMEKALSIARAGGVISVPQEIPRRIVAQYSRKIEQLDESSSRQTGSFIGGALGIVALNHIVLPSSSLVVDGLLGGIAFGGSFLAHRFNNKAKDLSAQETESRLSFYQMMVRDFVRKAALKNAVSDINQVFIQKRYIDADDLGKLIYVDSVYMKEACVGLQIAVMQAQKALCACNGSDSHPKMMSYKSLGLDPKSESAAKTLYSKFLRACQEDDCFHDMNPLVLPPSPLVDFSSMVKPLDQYPESIDIPSLNVPSVSIEESLRSCDVYHDVPGVGHAATAGEIRRVSFFHPS